MNSRERHNWFTKQVVPTICVVVTNIFVHVVVVAARSTEKLKNGCRTTRPGSFVTWDHVDWDYVDDGACGMEEHVGDESGSF